MTIKLWHIAAVLGIGYVAYRKSRTGAWPWDSAPSTPGVFTISLFNPERAMGQATTAPTFEAAQVIYQQYKASCPTCKVVMTGPDGSIISQIDALTA